MNDLIQQIVPYLISIVTVVLGYVAFRVGKVIDGAMNKYNIYDTIKTNQTIVKASVEYAEQVFKEAKGQEKFDLAKERAVQIFKDRGIEISEKELNTLIEQSVFQFKNGLNDSKIDVTVVNDNGETSIEEEYPVAIEEDTAK